MVNCEKCKSSDTYLYAIQRNGFKGIEEKTYDCKKCNHRTTITKPLK